MVVATNGFVIKTFEERFWPKVETDPNSGCWLWAGSLLPMGYGRMAGWKPSGRYAGYAHRMSYEHFVGAIPDGMEIDHLCRVRCCVNPAHLEPVTTKENLYRIPNFQAGRTHCTKGHEYTPENTYAYENKKRGYTMRDCLICRRARTARHDAVKVRPSRAKPKCP